MAETVAPLGIITFALCDFLESSENTASSFMVENIMLSAASGAITDILYFSRSLIIDENFISSDDVGIRESGDSGEVTSETAADSRNSEISPFMIFIILEMNAALVLKAVWRESTLMCCSSVAALSGIFEIARKEIMSRREHYHERTDSEQKGNG